MEEEKEDKYVNPINTLFDFNVRAGTLAAQITALGSSVYSPTLISAANILTEQYKAIGPISNMLPRIDISFPSQVAIASREANLAISNLVNNENVVGLASAAALRPTSWLNEINAIHTIAPPMNNLQGAITYAENTSAGARIHIGNTTAILNTAFDALKASEIGIQSHFSRLSATSILAESALSSFQWNNLANQIVIDNSTRLKLSDSFVAFSESYSDLFKAIQVTPGKIIDYNPAIIRQTPVEYYTGAALCRVISVPEESVLEGELITNKILLDNKIGLERKLPQINPDLVMLWQGANEALESNNPDKVRHFSTSVRELITQVLHHLSPDQEIEKWSTEPTHFKDGRPTREARLLYISREVNVGKFQNFIKRDISATIEFIKLFQEGTHKVKPSFSEKQLLALKAKAESTVNFLIDIGLKAPEL